MYNSDVKGNATLILYNSSGAKLLSRQVTVTEGVNTLRLSTSSLAAGTYFVQIITSTNKIAELNTSGFVVVE